MANLYDRQPSYEIILLVLSGCFCLDVFVVDWPNNVYNLKITDFVNITTTQPTNDHSKLHFMSMSLCLIYSLNEQQRQRLILSF